MTIKISPEQTGPSLPVVDNIFADAAFRSIIAEAFRLQPINIAMQTGDDTYNIPAFLSRRALGKKTVILGAGFDKTGVIPGIDNGNYPEIIEGLAKELASTDTDYLEVRTTHHIPCLQDQSDKVELKVNLQPSVEHVWDNLSGNTRKNIRRPLKRGFSYRIGKDPVLMDEFYQLYRMSLHDIGSLPHPKQFFSRLLKQCSAHMEIFVGYMDNKPVVASVNFVDETEVYGAWSGIHHDYKKYNVFLAMLWKIVEYCGESGRKTYNLGRSSAGSNPHQFKLKLANQSRRIYYYKVPLKHWQPSRSRWQEAASWVIRNTPEVVMDGLSRALIHRFY